MHSIENVLAQRVLKTGPIYFVSDLVALLGSYASKYMAAYQISSHICLALPRTSATEHFAHFII